MSRDTLGFEFALVGFVSPVLKKVDEFLQSCTEATLRNIVLCLVAGLFIGFVLRQTEPRREPVNIVGIKFPPWLPSAVCCLFATYFLMQL